MEEQHASTVKVPKGWRRNYDNILILHGFIFLMAQPKANIPSKSASGPPPEACLTPAPNIGHLMKKPSAKAEGSRTARKLETREATSAQRFSRSRAAMKRDKLLAEHSNDHAGPDAQGDLRQDD